MDRLSVVRPLLAKRASFNRAIVTLKVEKWLDDRDKEIISKSIGCTS
jgi:hypothetical protein